VESADHADLDAELSAALGSDVTEGDADRSPSRDDTRADDSGLGYDPSARSSS